MDAYPHTKNQLHNFYLPNFSRFGNWDGKLNITIIHFSFRQFSGKLNDETFKNKFKMPCFVDAFWTNMWKSRFFGKIRLSVLRCWNNVTSSKKWKKLINRSREKYWTGQSKEWGKESTGRSVYLCPIYKGNLTISCLL